MPKDKRMSGDIPVPAFFAYIWVVFRPFGMKECRRLRRLLIGIVFIGVGSLLATPMLAQCPNTIPNVSEYGTGSYSVKKVSTPCLPLTVNVKNTLPGSVNVRTIFDYKGGLINPDSLKTDTLHTYTRPGKYTIVQFSEQAGRKLIACPTVYVYDTLPPGVRLVSCGQSQANLIFESNPTSPYDSHWIAWGDGNILELSPYTQSVSHTFDTPPPHSITVWGTVNPGLCRSRDIVLKFDPNSSTQVPSIKSLTSQNASSAELVAINPLETDVLLFKKLESGIWESTGSILKKANETLRVTLDSLSSSCFRLQATDSCLTESYVSEIICSAILQVKSSDRANELSWKTEQVPPQAKITIMKDGTFWKEVRSQGTAGYLDDPDLSCGRQHCYQLVISSPTQRIATQLLCKNTPSSFCSLAIPLFIPDVFSPNGDGINDDFVIKGEIPSAFDLTVFSPWGTVIFHTTDPVQYWNGKYQNTWVPAGTYLYSLTVGDWGSGGRFTRTGSVLVIK